MKEIKFKNGSYIKVIDGNGINIKRSENKPYFLTDKEIFEFYKNNPDKFFEKMFGIKFLWYQKILLKMYTMFKK